MSRSDANDLRHIRDEADYLARTSKGLTWETT